ncbi:SMODS domain-containing nucleotidyltransferase [Demequina aestuarii]|uniref:SMODS domain-containing nucleotidyltransferase n=1 Tax=Demequina aestuarii TaxID=327095 RepID=UPI000780EF8A|nr:hypothetical protein [Demequina aestuarii]
MKLIKQHDAFLKDVVNLRAAHLSQLEDRVAAVSRFIDRVDHPIGKHFNELIPQGSYAQRTIINPVGDRDELDADVLLDLDEVDGWVAADYVTELYKAFGSAVAVADGFLAPPKGAVPAGVRSHLSR